MSTGRWATTLLMESFKAASSIRRRIFRARDSTERTLPEPAQRGQVSREASFREGRRRWRDISSNPKREI